MSLTQSARAPYRVVAIAVAVLLVLALSVWLVHTRDTSGTARADGPSTGTITVSGQGMVQGVPDTLTATLDVHAKDADVQSALNDSSAAARQVINALKAHGVSADDVQTSDLSLDQSYDDHGTIDGYDSDETLTVKIHPLTHVGKILAAATTAAGNHVSVNGLSLDITDNAALLNAARAKAFANAKGAATQDATLAGRQLGSVTSVRETRTTATNPVTFDEGLAFGADAAKASVPIRAGKQPVTVTVDVVWSLQ